MSKTNKNKPCVVKANSKSEVDLSEIEGILSASEKDPDLDEVIESNCSIMTAIATATSTTVTIHMYMFLACIRLYTPHMSILSIFVLN